MVEAFFAPCDYVRPCSPGAEGGDEFPFDAGDRAVENSMGFVAKGGYGFFHQAFVIKNRFVGIERAEFLPV